MKLIKQKILLLYLYVDFAQAHVKCIVDLDGVESADDAPDTSYYQWVTFMFAIQVGRK